MKFVFAEEAWDDYQHWLKHDHKRLERINALIKEGRAQPFLRHGKPEPLKHALAGWWSRRIYGEHRFVYRVVGDELHIAQLRYHY